jgi:predicted permease
MFFSVLGIIAPVFLIIATGYLSVRAGYFEAGALKGLGAFVFRIGMPALILSAVTRAPLGETMNHAYLLGYGGATFGIFLLGYAAMRRLGGQAVTPAAVRALGMAGSNTGFMGYPIAVMVVGQAAAGPFTQNMLIESIVILPVAMTIAEVGMGASRSRRALGRTIALSLARNPLMIAMVIGMAIAATGLGLPGPATKALSLVGAAGAPVALFAVGGTLAGIRADAPRTGIGWVVGGKLLAHPMLAAGALWFMPGIDPTTFACGVIFAGAPILTIYPIIAGRFGESKFGAVAMFLATVGSAVTLSVILWLLAHRGFVAI